MIAIVYRGPGTTELVPCLFRKPETDTNFSLHTPTPTDTSIIERRRFFVSAAATGNILFIAAEWGKSFSFMPPSTMRYHDRIINDFEKTEWGRTMFNHEIGISLNKSLSFSRQSHFFRSECDETEIRRLFCKMTISLLWDPNGREFWVPLENSKPPLKQRSCYDSRIILVNEGDLIKIPEQWNS